MSNTTFETAGAVVVGTDLSDRAKGAVDWAAERANLGKTPLVIVQAVPQVPIPSRSRLFDAMIADEWPERILVTAQERLDEWCEHVRSTYPDMEVRTAVVKGAPAEVLAEASRTAELVVVGARGESAPLKVRALGGTADAVVRHASGPIAVITDLAEPAEGGPVVVGVDDSEPARPALHMAADEAALRGLPLLAVHAWDTTAWVSGPMGTLTVDPKPAMNSVYGKIDDVLAPIREEHPDLEASGDVIDGRASLVLVEASRKASLVVVGARGLGGFAGLLLGSTSRYVLREAFSPVIVVRASE